MRDIINATLCSDHFLKCDTYSIARNGEGLTPCLSVTIPENLCKYWAYIDFKKPNDETFKTPRIDVVEGKITYNIPGAVLDAEGKLEVQIVFQNDLGEIWKSYVKEFAVRYSINATDDIPDKQDFITEGQKVIDEALEVAKDIEDRANNGEFKGDKGDKGDAGAVKFLVVTELPTVDIDESAIYLVPSQVGDTNNFAEFIYVDGKWEQIGSASVEVDLSDYLKAPPSVDYQCILGRNANSEENVWAKLDASYGVAIYPDGRFGIVPATESEISKKTTRNKPISPITLDYAVKVGLTTNTNELTDEEKAAALAWLGGVKAIPDSYRVYATKANGALDPKYYTDSATGATIVYRDSKGCAKFGTPTENAHAANKAYVDSLVSPKYELIETIEVTEDMVISRTQEPDGTPYNFKRVRIWVETTATNFALARFNFKSASNYQINYHDFAALSNITGTRRSWCEVYPNCGLWTNRQIAWTQYNGYATTQEYAGDFENVVTTEQAPTIGSISTATKVAAGTTIKIWGVRA